MSLLSKDEIEKALARLGELALDRDTPIELLLVGGAAMVLAYNARLSTHDVDAIILSPRQVEVVRSLILLPGRELKAQYAFLDLWETQDDNS